MPTFTSSNFNNAARLSATGTDIELYQKQLSGMSRVPSIPIRIDEQSIQSGAKEVLRVVRPHWTIQENESKIKSKVFTEGLSNKLVGFFVDENKEDIVIVKVFGTNTDHMIDRQAEIETMKLLFSRNCGAELYATFDNGICYEYMRGVTLEVEHCQDPKMYSMVAAEMARMHSDTVTGEYPVILQGGTSTHEETHSQQLSNGSSPFNGLHRNNKNPHYHSRHRYRKSQIWNKLRQFNKLAEEIMETDPGYRQSLKSIGVTEGWGAQSIVELQSILESHSSMPVTFCHNDLLPRNIVYDDKREKITFIDVEYAMFNYAPFDVANHFLEFAGVDQIDYSKYPDQRFRHCWLREYLKHLKVENISDEPITIEKFDFWVQLCVPLSHLLWGLWGIYQAKHSTIEFDYPGYVQLRLLEFKKHMEKLRGLNVTLTDKGQA